MSESPLMTLNSETFYPVLPLRDTVVFPHMVVPLFVGRPPSKAASQFAVRHDLPLFIVAQKGATDVEGYPGPSDLYGVGTLAKVLQVLTLPDGTLKVLVRGEQCAKINEIQEDEAFLRVRLERSAAFDLESVALESTLAPLLRSLKERFEVFAKDASSLPQDLVQPITDLDDPAAASYTIASYLSIPLAEKQVLLEAPSIRVLMETVLEYLERTLETQNIEKRIRDRVRVQMEKSHKEYLLQEQLKAIQKEMDTEEDDDELELLKKRIDETVLSDEAREKALHELKRLRKMNPMAPDASVVRTYIEWLLDMPWAPAATDAFEMSEAKKILDADHYGLQDVKERILEYLAVQKRVGKAFGQVLCFVGPPGVGKTSLARSIAQATERPFVRISLGGVHDEAEIRGHRRTYIGAMPGRIIQAMKKVKATNPVILLDEIDKMSSDWRGDPAAALLEVLDPEQNKAFNDHYLDIDYDLSNVLFLTTANTFNLPRPLLDRMEVIRLPGYTQEEKIQIAERHLLPKQRKEHHLSESEFKISNKAMEDLISLYTREAGVRACEREIAKIARKVVRMLSESKTTSVQVTPRNLAKYLGVPRFQTQKKDLEDAVGVTHGLAWTESGGEVLLVEAVITPGKGRIRVTGKLGEVMQESAQAASSYVRSRALGLGISWELLENRDIHLHFPEGATPKDGPSAGIAICTSIVSILTGIPVHGNVAMTGEISLQGRVLPIGGLKEKVLAAVRAGIAKILIPEENVKDLQDIPDSVKNKVVIQPVTRIEQVFEHGLTKRLEVGEWLAPLLVAATGVKQGDESAVTH